MGSRATPVAGGAVWTSANAVLERAKRIAAHLLEAAEADIVVEDGVFHVAGSPDRCKTWAEIGTAGFQGASLPEGLRIGCLEELTHFEPSNFTFPAGAYCCVVEIDRETGGVRVRDFVAVDDCGVVINPLLAAGQVMGGVAQGIAQALFESVEYDPESGQPRTATLLDYLVPSAAEYPSFVLDHIETPTPSNPLGAKGLGESGAVGATPAVVNAVVDALSHLGVRDVAMPCTPQRIWQHLSGQG
jgi:carbon-monoxide dehydrogenase large subunit